MAEYEGKQTLMDHTDGIPADQERQQQPKQAISFGRLVLIMSFLVVLGCFNFLLLKVRA